MRLSTWMLWVIALTGCLYGIGEAQLCPEIIKGLWVDTWDQGMLTPEQCDHMLAYARTYGFNTILAEVRRLGDAYYKSAYEPTAINIKNSFDPLAYLCKKTKENNPLRLEAWMVLNRVHNGKKPPRITEPPHCLSLHPAWKLLDKKGSCYDTSAGDSIFLDLSNPEVRRYNALLAQDAAGKYPVDAIHLDYIRYPGSDWGYNPDALERYARDTKKTARPEPLDSDFIRWRADQVTETIKEIRHAIKKVNPSVQLTACGVTWGATAEGMYYKSAGYRQAFQDWPDWLAGGSVDVLYVMHYKREFVPDQARDFRQWLSVLEAHRSSGRIVVGMGSYLNDIDASIAQASAVWKSRLDGIAVYSYRVPNRGVPDKDQLGKQLMKLPRWIQ